VQGFLLDEPTLTRYSAETKSQALPQGCYEISSLKRNPGNFAISERDMTDTSEVPLLPTSLLPRRCPGPRRSLCMIVRNEEQNLAACLESVADLMAEIV